MPAALPGRGSIAARLLRLIFAAYFVVTLVVTAVQLGAEYRHTEQRVLSEIAALDRTFGPAISEAVWRFNQDVLRGLLAGVQEVPIVLGVKVVDAKGDVIGAVGEVRDREGRPLRMDGPGADDRPEGRSGLFSESVSRSFPVMYVDERGRRHAIGEWTVYSGQRVVVQQVQYGFLLIVAGAVIKTLALWFIFFQVVERWLGKPLRTLNDFVAGLTLERLGAQVAPPAGRGHNELQALATTINEMSAKLAQSVRENTTLQGRLGEESAGRQKAEESAQRSESLYRGIVEDAIEAILRVSLSGRMLGANPAAARLLGYGSVAELLSSSDNVRTQLYAHPEDRDALLATLHARGSVANMEVEMRRRDGRILWTSLSARLVRDLDGRPLHIQTFASDVTDRKRAEAELARHRAHLEELVQERTVELHQAKETAELASRAKSSFLANMSHELRSPLNAMLGFARLLSRDPELAPRARDDLGVVLRSGEHLFGLINQVLEMSKIESGQVAADPVGFDLHNLLEELTEIYAVTAQNKGLSLETQVAPGMPRHVRADAVKLRQVLVNLLSNAIKFTERGGVLLKAMSLGDGRVRFEIVDTGVGIAEKDLPRLEEPFVQAEAGRRSGEGAGLGLAICRGFSQMLGGELAIHSKLGVGTSVRFTLPLTMLDGPAPATAVMRSRVRGLAAGERAWRLLAVDDMEEGRRLLVRLLEPLGFEVREAADGEEALKTWREWRPHLIWMDMRMPGMDGMSATRRIRAEAERSWPVGPHPVIVALTASSFEEQRREILAAGCDDFLRKPFAEEALFEVLVRRLGVRFDVEAPAVVAPVDVWPRPDLPAALRDALQRALDELDVDGIEAAIEAIAPDHPAVAARLAPLARDFEYDRIAEWLHSGDSQPTT